MTPLLGRADAAAAYEQLLQRVYPAGVTACPPPFTHTELAQLWLDARLEHGGNSLHHGTIRILDFGTANPAPTGPAILRADIECDGRRLRGDIALHLRAEDWETEGCGEKAEFDNVVLHVVLHSPPAAWYTRNAAHRDIPVYVVPTAILRDVCGCARLYPAPAEALPLQALPAERLSALFRAAAAYRAELKAVALEQKAAVIGQEQAWFEAWAEVLGYAANKRPMRALARRVTPEAARGKDTEALYLGTAGFLQAVLPERTTQVARDYHRRIWAAWWPLREQFAYPAEQALSWVLSPVRPMNHPARRVAALALSAQRWGELQPLMNAAGAKRLTEALCALSHPFWDAHCTLAASPLRRPCALVGKTRAADFLANVVYPADRSPAAWETYLHLRAADVPARVRRLAAALFGERTELSSLLHLHHVQQAILQLHADFHATAEADD